MTDIRARNAEPSGRRSARWWLLLLAAGAWGCAGAEPVTGAGARTAAGAGQDDRSATEQGEPVTDQTEPVRVVAYTGGELSAKFESARAKLLVGQYEQAAKELDHLSRLAEEPQLKGLCLYNSGLAYTGLGKHAIAIKRYQTLLDHHPGHNIAKHGAVRLNRLLGYLERWVELEKAAEKLLARSDLVLMDRIEGHGGHALALVEQDKRELARRALAKAQAIIDKNGFGRSGVPPIQLAQVSFAEGELRRLDSEDIKLVPVPDNFAAVLEARCQGLLDAQASYTDAMRSRDIHWSAMSGYRVGLLYKQLHTEATAIPPPSSATLKQRQLFEAAMRLRYRILLEKGLRMMTGTVGMGERTGEGSAWIARAREAKRQLEQSLADEKAALKASPYTEDEIRAALEKLKKGKQP